MEMKAKVITLKKFLKNLDSEQIVRVFQNGEPVFPACSVKEFKASIPYHELRKNKVIYMIERPVPYGKLINVHFEK